MALLHPSQSMRRRRHYVPPAPARPVIVESMDLIEGEETTEEERKMMDDYWAKMDPAGRASLLGIESASPRRQSEVRPHRFGMPSTVYPVLVMTRSMGTGRWKQY